MVELKAPIHSIRSVIRLSGSKSISNRLLILKEIFKWDTTFQNLSNAEDTKLLEQAIAQLKGKESAVIDIHHAGTDMRFLAALLATHPGEWILTGSDRMKERPIGELVTALKSLGADISYLEKENYPPLSIRGKKLEGGTIEMDSTVSSQFISALLLISPKFEKGLELYLRGETVSKPYIAMTLALLRAAGMVIEERENALKVLPSFLREQSATKPTSSNETLISVEADWSSASYWYSMCALAGNAEIELQGLTAKSLQADSVLPEIYKSLGVNTLFKENAILLKSFKPTTDFLTYDFTACPDIAQTVAVTCLGLGIGALLTGLRTLKVKETDRIVAMKRELEKFGATVSITAESIHLQALQQNSFEKNNTTLKTIQTYSDHRMAMSFAPLVVKLKSLGIDDVSVVSKSYPSFWEDLKSVGFNVNLQP